MNKVNLGYGVIFTYKKVESITIDTDIVDKDQAIDYALDCLSQDIFLDEGYHLDINNDILKIEVIDNSVEIE